MVPKELTEEQKQRRVTICQDLLERQDDILGHVFTDDENTGLPIRPWNEAAKCTMEDCQFPITKKLPLVQIKSQNNVADFFILERLFIMNLYQLDKQATKFTIWKYWKGCVKKLDGNFYRDDFVNFIVRPRMRIYIVFWLFHSSFLYCNCDYSENATGINCFKIMAMGG